jgi:hypothetical protein
MALLAACCARELVVDAVLSLSAYEPAIVQLEFRDELKVTCAIAKEKAHLELQRCPCRRRG